MREEYDKLAWGLVREELRHHLGYLKDDTSIFDGLLNRVSSLSEARLRRVRLQAKKQMEERLSAFAFESYRTRLDDGGPHLNVDSMFFWEPEKFVIKNENSESSREERLLNLRHFRMALSKKRLTNEFVKCFISINEHTLYRMIQREAVPRLPLKYFSEDLNIWFPYAAHYLVSYAFLEDRLGQNIFIPYRDGALLGKMGYTEVPPMEDGLPSSHIRMISSPWGNSTITPPFEHILCKEVDGKQVAITLNISTWIPERFFHSEQWWAKFRIKEFRKQFSHSFESSQLLLTGDPRPIDDELVEITSRNLEEFSKRFVKLFGDKRWAIACNW